MVNIPADVSLSDIAACIGMHEDTINIYMFIMDVIYFSDEPDELRKMLLKYLEEVKE